MLLIQPATGELSVLRFFESLFPAEREKGKCYENPNSIGHLLISCSALGRWRQSGYLKSKAVFSAPTLPRR